MESATKQHSDTAVAAVMKAHQLEVWHYETAPDRFLIAWKQAIEKIGPAYFHCEGTDHYSKAIHRHQIRPNAEAIEQRLGVCSMGEGVFIGAVISFYNGDWGAEVCQSFGYAGMGDIANRLDLELVKILTQLMLNHTGW